MNPTDASAANPTSALPPILLIDDERALLDVLTAALSPYFEVTTAKSEREAEFILYEKQF